MEAKASLQYLHIAPRKVRLVASLVRGMEVRRAELILHTLPKRSSMPLFKLLKSAIQNAVHDFQQDPASLYIKEIKVDGGPMMKRMMPRAFGRGATIRKRMSHVSLVLGVRGEGARGSNKKKIAKPVVREAGIEEIKGEMDHGRKSDRLASGTGAKKKSGKFSKKTFTRKVI